MTPLAQEQLRVLLLDVKNRVMGQRVVYQGNVNGDYPLTTRRYSCSMGP